MKKIAKSFVAKILAWQVRRLRKKNNFKVIAVTGSIGKTSTKLAIVSVLSQKFSVKSQQGNYNDIVSVPLILFDQPLPNIFNPLAWLKIFRANERVIKQPFPYQVVVMELGSDGPGQIKQFANYHPDISVLTAITPEHMEFFADLDAVAFEETAVANFSDKLLINADLCDPKYLADLPIKYTSYSIKHPSDVYIGDIRFEESAASFTLVSANKSIQADHHQITEPQLYSVCAAAAVALEMGLDGPTILSGIRSIKPVSGRMQYLTGLNNTLIIDDTYNASPEATRAALDSLYRMKASQKIAILGNMNELGSYSEVEHRQIGEYCDPSKIDLVITLGPDANKYLAPAATSKGCKVKQFDSPYEVGEYLKPIIKPGAVILAKGSQNGVFAEEAVKLLLANSADSAKLVRQTEHWLKIKQKAFKQA